MHTLKINKGRDTITLGVKVDGVYPVIGASLLTEGRHALLIGSAGCANGVENMDHSSDWSDCFGLSSRMEVDGFVIAPTR